MIAVIAAMDKEVDAIVSIMESHEHLMKSGIDFDKRILAGKELLVMKSGVGKGNAGMATTILLENFSIDCIVNIGTAGGLQMQQNILDAVISTQVVQHDYDTSPVDGADGIGLYFEADQDLCDMCEQALNKLGVVVHRGLVASGDQFVAREAQLQRLNLLRIDDGDLGRLILDQRAAAEQRQRQGKKSVAQARGERKDHHDVLACCSVAIGVGPQSGRAASAAASAGPKGLVRSAVSCSSRKA